MLESWLIKSVEIIIQLYRLSFRMWLGGQCRFNPSCSEYALESLKELGLWTGLRKAFLRLMRCHPFHPGGWEPVTR